MTKTDIQTFEIDGQTVRLERVPVRRDQWFDWMGLTNGEKIGPKREQALYEIYIDDVLMGYATRAYGFGKQPWNIDRLCPHLTYTDGLKSDRLTKNGTFYDGFDDHPKMINLETVAHAAVRLRSFAGEAARGPFLAPAEELEEFARQYREETEEREREGRRMVEESNARYAAEKARKRAEAEHVVEGLKSIDERLKSSLTNHETDALRLAIEAMSKSDSTYPE